MGKTAVITGGSKGIGKETAVLFAKNGYNVAICARDEPSLRKAADELTKTNKNIFYQKCDVSKSNDVTDFAANTIKKFGSIDVLVNNAGIFDLALLGDTSEKMWDDMININLKGMFLMTKEVLPVMLKNKKGHIINISSQAGKIAFPMDTAYGASKFGVVGFSRCLAEELKDTAIKVAIVYHGPVDTPLFDNVDKRKMAGFPPREAFLKPAAVADAVFGLVQKQSGYIEEVDVV